MHFTWLFTENNKISEFYLNYDIDISINKTQYYTEIINKLMIIINNYSHLNGEILIFSTTKKETEHISNLINNHVLIPNDIIALPYYRDVSDEITDLIINDNN